jgi:hypothetical protein
MADELKDYTEIGSFVICMLGGRCSAYPNCNGKLRGDFDKMKGEDVYIVDPRNDQLRRVEIRVNPVSNPDGGSVCFEDSVLAQSLPLSTRIPVLAKITPID